MRRRALRRWWRRYYVKTLRSAYARPPEPPRPKGARPLVVQFTIDLAVLLILIGCLAGFWWTALRLDNWLRSS